MVKVLLVAGLLLATLVSGCTTAPTTSGNAAPAPAAFQDVVVTDTTGAIRGVVVTEAIVPIEGALVVLAGGQNRTSDADGAFVFNGLEPGDYFLTVSKLGYFSVQASAVVVAGEAEPRVTKVTLLVEQATQPFAEILQWRAFLQCGANAVVASTNPCAFTGSDNVHDFFFGAGAVPHWAQAEAVWTGTQPTGNYLNMGWHRAGTADFKSANGASPLLLTVNQTAIIDEKGEDVEHLTVRIFPGRAPDMTPTVVLNQAYDIYVSYFYNFVPREGYMFAVDGPCQSPEQCG